MDDRIVAILIDNVPLIGVSISLAAQAVLQGPSVVNVTFSPFVYVVIGGACVSLIPIVVLGILESRTGTTCCKRLMGL